MYLDRIHHMALLTELLPEALAAVGALLAEEGDQATIIVVGGASLNLLGLIERTTQDVRRDCAYR